jgi:hypothetical protein
VAVYYLVVVIAGESSADAVGAQFDTPEQAREEAVISAQDIAAYFMSIGRPLEHCSVQVEASDGSIVATVPLQVALRSVH